MTAPATLHDDHQQLAAPLREAWIAILEHTGQRAFQRERPLPGFPLPPVHQEVWSLTETLLHDAPEFLPARLARLQILLSLHQYPEAEREARDLIALAPCHPAGHFYFRRIAALRGGLAEARALHSQSQAGCPELGELDEAPIFLRKLLLSCYPQESIAAFHRHFEANPGNGEVAVALAEMYLMGDDIETALQLLRTADAAQPGQPQVLLLLGAIEAESEDLASAQQHFQQVLELDPLQGQARVHLARTYAEQGRLDQAAKVLRAEWEAHSGDAEYNLLLGQVALALGQSDVAGKAYVQALAAGLEDPEDVTECEEALQQLGLWSEKNVALQYLLAERALDNGDALRAIKHLTAVKEHGAETREVYLKLAEAHAAMGLVDDPLNFLIAARALKRRTYDSHGIEDPSDRRLDLLMTSLLLETGQYSPEQALEKLGAWREVEKIEGEPESFFTVLAGCLFQCGETEAAKRALAAAIRQNPLDPLGWAELGGLLEELGEPAGAARAWWEVVEQSGGLDADLLEHLIGNYAALGETAWAEGLQLWGAAVPEPN